MRACCTQYAPRGPSTCVHQAFTSMHATRFSTHFAFTRNHQELYSQPPRQRIVIHKRSFIQEITYYISYRFQYEELVKNILLLIQADEKTKLNHVFVLSFWKITIFFLEYIVYLSSFFLIYVADGFNCFQFTFLLIKTEPTVDYSGKLAAMYLYPIH